nr:MAG TPA: hypothetical protein [Caudoviricetes sp.]
MMFCNGRGSAGRRSGLSLSSSILIVNVNIYRSFSSNM